MSSWNTGAHFNPAYVLKKVTANNLKGTSNPKCLLVNPWIHDFAAYDLWLKPLGLLYTGAVLREHGYKIDMIDLLDRGVFDLSPMITNHYSLDEWETAFANLRARQDVKALVFPNGRDWAD